MFDSCLGRTGYSVSILLVISVASVGIAGDSNKNFGSLTTPATVLSFYYTGERVLDDGSKEHVQGRVTCTVEDVGVIADAPTVRLICSTEPTGGQWAPQFYNQQACYVKRADGLWIYPVCPESADDIENPKAPARLLYPNQPDEQHYDRAPYFLGIGEPLDSYCTTTNGQPWYEGDVDGVCYTREHGLVYMELWQGDACVQLVLDSVTLR